MLEGEFIEDLRVVMGDRASCQTGSRCSLLIGRYILLRLDRECPEAFREFQKERSSLSSRGNGTGSTLYFGKWRTRSGPWRKRRAWTTCRS